MRTPTKKDYREAAERLFGQEGSVEIDDDAKVSRGADEGAYVQAWVWVPNEEANKRTGPSRLFPRAVAS